MVPQWGQSSCHYLFPISAALLVWSFYHLLCRSCSINPQFFFRKNCCIYKYRFSVFVGESEFRVFLSHHLGSPVCFNFNFRLYWRSYFEKWKYTKPEVFSIYLFPNSYQSDASFLSFLFFWKVPKGSCINQYSWYFLIKLFLSWWVWVKKSGLSQWKMWFCLYFLRKLQEIEFRLPKLLIQSDDCLPF